MPVATIGAQASALLAKPPARRTVHSIPALRTVSSRPASGACAGVPGRVPTAWEDSSTTRRTPAVSACFISAGPSTFVEKARAAYTGPLPR
ncbi:hypothetical protein J2S40_003967 [Nocardioides luteus]|uniref:Uncharacterized protein n=1 Tax=Nocardioides luteus TaxID=1844 RepID=A0ABQ5SQP0_9ACTN|nr:hypothetical protein [Nocardioides luteus]MDR7312909.1 hypothetical protein [Nocardioides luteus]GGR45446.1 hypothetical protein GCM10010197_08900 [Nocardioides luteus]GLJ65970.1 hypothetical protein GCM10017579_00060 [Nocardioides luteus]